MLYWVHVMVATALRAGATGQDAVPPDDGWEETVSYFFGINAATAAAAVALAETAAEHARDRDGRFIGGAVLQLQVRSAAAQEFDQYEHYLLRPTTADGIFYVSGTTTSGLPNNLLASGRERLADMRESIRRNGLPPPSFLHPKPPEGTQTGRRSRIACPSCGRWAEFDSAGVIYSLFDGLDPDSREAQVGRQTGATLGRFVEEHLQCLAESGHVALVFLHEGEPGFDALTPDRKA